MLKLAVLVSGGGTNLQAIIDSIEAGRIQQAEIRLIISSNSKAYAIERGKKHKIKTLVIGKENFSSEDERTDAIINALTDEEIDLVILAGYMSILQPRLVRAFKGRIINIHPSLIPKYCGAGFYGKRVHQAVLDASERETGATVHYVDEGVDTGPIILQEKVPVMTGDTAEQLADRVLNTEHKLLTEAINLVIEKLRK